MVYQKLKGLVNKYEGLDLDRQRIDDDVVEFVHNDCELLADVGTENGDTEINLFKYKDIYIVYNTDSHNFMYVFFKDVGKSIEEFKETIYNDLDLSKDDDRLKEVVSEIKNYIDGEDVPPHLRSVCI